MIAKLSRSVYYKLLFIAILSEFLTVSLQLNCPCLGAVSVMPADTSCFPCDPVNRLQTPSVVYSEMSSVFTFTSCLFPALLYVLYILYSFTILQHSVAGRSLAGLPLRSLLAVRKLTLIGLVTTRSPKPVPLRHLPRRASLNENEAHSTAA